MDIIRGFVIKYIGVPIDFDGMYGAECVDLFRRYCANLGIERTESVSGASELFTGYDERPILGKFFKRFSASDMKFDVYPRIGDCIVWDKNPNYGHVAICLSADHELLTVFEQIGYTKDDNVTSVSDRKKYLSASEMKLNAAHIWTYASYDGVLGWLRPRGIWVS